MSRTTEQEARTPATSDVILVAGNGRVWTHEIGGLAAVVIGRDPACEITIDDPGLSRRHARLCLSPLTVQDLGSTNGTNINGRVARGGEPTRLAPGESFQISGYSFLVVTAGATSSSQHSREPLRISDPTIGAASQTLTDIAQSNLNVLILGESGTGKEVLAETLHALSKRRGPLQKINCAALPVTLFESELFGHEKNAFTGATAARAGLLEAASGGTVFLDEIGEMALGVQAKLLRAIENREIVRLGAVRATTIDVRFVCATHRDLAQEVADRRFRQDLHFRIDGITLRLPPLRERAHLVTQLAMQFARAAGATGGVSPEALACLEAYAWPGNIRELKAVIERAALLARGKPIAERHLAFTPQRTPSIAHERAPEVRAAPELDAAQSDERAKIVAALEQCSHNQTRAAAMLGMSRTALVTKLRIYRIPRPRS